jgi:hypothetical protein
MEKHVLVFCIYSLACGAMSASAQHGPSRVDDAAARSATNATAAR